MPNYLWRSWLRFFEKGEGAPRLNAPPLHGDFLSILTVSRKTNPSKPDSPLARAIRESVRNYCRAKSQYSPSIAALLEQFPKPAARLVLAAVDDLAEAGVITLTASGAHVRIEWCGDVDRPV